MYRNGPAAAFLGSFIGQFDQAADLAVGVEHHGPRQVCDLSSPQPCLSRQQDHYRVAQRVPGAAGVDEQVLNVVR